MSRSRIALAVVAAILSPGLAQGQSSAPDNSTRIVAGIASADQGIGDLEHIVVTMANKKTAWDNDILPTLELFLYGVTRDQPVRFDLMLHPEDGRLFQPVIPIAKLRDFLVDNLKPFGIDAARNRQDGELYNLSGNVIEDGYMRVYPEPVPYAVIYMHEEGIPKGGPHPQTQHQAFLTPGGLAFAGMKNNAEGAAQRKKNFAVIRKENLAAVVKQPDESKAAFDVRYKITSEVHEKLEQMVVETADAVVGIGVDRKASQANASLSWSSLPETDLARELNRLNESGMFTAIKAPQNSILSLRLQVPFNKVRANGMIEIAELSRPAAMQMIDEHEGPSAAEKTAQKEVANLIIDVVKDSLPIGMLNGYLDVFPNGNAHCLVMGGRCTNKEKLTQIFQKFPGMKQGWSIKMNVDNAGGVEIHEMTLTDSVPQSLINLFGASRKVYFAAADNAAYMATGEGALEALKARIPQTTAPGAGTADKVFASATAHVLPLLKTMHQFNQETDVPLLETLRKRGPLKTRAAGAQPKEGERKAQEKAQALANFQWQEPAIAALEGTDDLVELKIALTGDATLTGSGSAHSGLLKTLGTLIAKFTEENFN